MKERGTEAGLLAVVLKLLGLQLRLCRRRDGEGQSRDKTRKLLMEEVKILTILRMLIREEGVRFLRHDVRLAILR